MYERSGKILLDEKLDPSLNTMQFACYRNYNSEEKILEYSPWESNPNKLKGFMDSKGVEGGWGNEAIEIGLQHAVEEAKKCIPKDGKLLFQVYLIGDAAPNTQTEVKLKRERFPYWKKTQSVYWETELKKLQDLKVQVNTFYVNTRAKDSFVEIAKRTGGNCTYLDLSLPESQEILVNLFNPNILKMIGEANGDVKVAEKLVEAYLKCYKQ